MKKAFLIIFLILIFGLGIISFLNLNIEEVLAESITEKSPENVPLGLRQVVDRVHQISLILAGAVAVAMLVWAGFRLFFSADTPNIIIEAKERILFVFLGLLIVIFSIAILRIFVEPKEYIRVPPPPEIPDPPEIVIPEPPDEPVVLLPPEEDEVIEPPPIYIEKDVPLDKQTAKTKMEDHIKEEEEELRKRRFRGFVLREFLDVAPLKISGERLIIRDLNRIFRPEANVFETFTIVHVSIHHPRDKDGNMIYRYGLIFFEEPNFRGRCKIMVDGGIVWFPGWRPGSVRSFVMPVKSHYEPGDAIIAYQYPILRRTRIDPKTKEEIIVGKYHKDWEQNMLNPPEGPAYIPWHQDITPRPTYSLETISDPGKYMVILRAIRPPYHCYITLKNIPDFRNLWWTHATDPKAFFQEKIIGGPKTIQAVQVLRVY